MKGRTPTKKEKDWMDAAAKIGCIVCHLHEGTYSPASIHHIEGKTKNGAHLKSIPLCWFHHQSGTDDHTCVSRHPHKKAFESRYGDEYTLLAKTQEIARKNGWE